jgi:predicted RNase H-like nuclease
MKVIGLDACKEGWVAVSLIDGELTSIEVIEDLEDHLTQSSDASAIGIDIPIGLPGNSRRSADVEARRFVGPRWQSVFFTPPRQALTCATHAEATALCVDLTGSGMSRQTYGLKEKIFEVDRLYAQVLNLYEVHPEVSFRAMAGRNLNHPKKSWNGFAERLELLNAAGVSLPLHDRINGNAAPDDVVDAAAAAWTANRIGNGGARTLPEHPNTIYAERPVAIWY